MVAAGIVNFPDWTGYHKSEIQIPTRDGTSVRSLVYRPEGKEPGPLYVYFHGGGWSFGMPEYGEVMAEVLVKELGFTVVSVGYRYGPEHVFPTAAHDAIDAVKWVSIWNVIASNPERLICVSSVCRERSIVGRQPIQRLHRRRDVGWKQSRSCSSSPGC